MKKKRLVDFIAGIMYMGSVTGIGKVRRMVEDFS
jgi:hypothetical protein